MRAEYLLFDALVFLPPFLFSLTRVAGVRARLPALFFAIAATAVPFVAWDAAVAGRHWSFEPTRVLGVRLFGLPIEEVLFFVAVPFACLFTWETLLGGPRAALSSRLRLAPFAVMALLLPAAYALSAGREYTAAALAALALSAALDRALGTRLFEHPRYWLFLAVVSALGLLFNGYLTGRPIVLYGAPYFLGLRLGPVPLEDFVYGAAMTSSVAALFHWRLHRGPGPSLLAKLIEWKLGGYRQQLNRVDRSLPEKVSGERRVAVIGGGLAGLSAAALLAERGFQVTLLEKNAYLGGKLGAWRERLTDGFEADVEHGFHAFFRHYYNLNELLSRVGVRRKLVPVPRYLILTRDGKELSFDGRDSVPVLNLLALARRGLYRLKEVALGPAGQEMEAFLRYDREATFAQFDSVPFSAFSAKAQLPGSLRTVFTTFSRAFFADEDELSTAELIKSFHFYYLSHDRGLVYDYLAGGYDADLLAPFERYLSARGVVVRRSTPVGQLRRAASGALEVDGQLFEHVVLAADVRAAQALLRAQPLVQAEDPQLLERLSAMRAGRRYAVLRLWLDRRAREGFPVFVSTERVGELDAVAFLEQADPRCAAWAKTNGGTVLELHSYAVSDGCADEQAVRDGLLAGLHHFLPELREAKVVHEHLQVRNDFTALHVGMAASRPGVSTRVKGLHLAGDWVALPMPAMLMEAAHTSALLAVNQVCEAERLQPFPVYSVPLRGVLHGVPRPPQRRAAPVR